MLINGKTLEQIRAELLLPEKKAGDKEGKPYYEHWQFKKRLDSVFGLNYSTEYSQVQTVSCGKQTLMSCVCTITILADEDLRPVIKRSGVGGREFVPFRSGDGHANFQSIPSFTERAAFCEACKEFGMFGNFESSGNGNGKGVVNKATLSGNVSGNFKQGTFITHSVMTSDTKRNGEVVYTLNVVDDSNVQQYQIIFYENQYKKVSDIFEQLKNHLLTADLVKGVKVNILYTEGSMGGLIFKGFPKKEG